MAHTPGPWKPDPKSPRYILAESLPGAPGQIVAEVRPVSHGDTAGNITLIASAPALLAALEALVHPDGLSSLNLTHNLAAARAAIAQARGEHTPDAREAAWSSRWRLWEQG